MSGAIKAESSMCNKMPAALHKSGELFEKVFICQQDAILILDNEYVPKIVECNPATEKIFGYGREELTGQPVSILHPGGEVLKEFRESIISSVDKQGFCYFPELRRRRKDGTLFPCECTVARLKDSWGERLGWTSIIHDITNRVETEKALAEDARKIKQFAYTICHDLKNPAIALRWFANRLSDRYGMLLNEQGKLCCDRIRKASEEIALFVDRLNEYITSKELPLSIEEIDLDGLFQDISEEFLQRAREIGVRLSAPRCLVKLRADRICLVRALRNLIENALKHGGDRLTEISLGYTESDEFHVIEVKDDGVGLVEEDNNAIFDLFRRGRRSRGIPGVGLGLSIVKEIAVWHGGSISTGPGPHAEFFLSISKRL